MTPNTQKMTETLERLCEISRSQLEALTREDYLAFRNLLDQKDALLAGVADLAAKRIGNSLTAEQKKALETFRAHELYVQLQVSEKTQEIGDRLNATARRRNAINGYSSISPNFITDRTR